MKQWLRTLFALPVSCGVAAGAPPKDYEELKAIDERRNCEFQLPARVVYAGDSSLLGACLERLGKKDAIIDELRITSGGGDAWVTLELARGLRGKLDLIVVDALCASSCANYLVPAAKRVRIEPGSYVLLHGSLSHRDATPQHDAIRKSVAEQMRARPGGENLTDEAVATIAQQAIDTLHADLTARIPVQDAFARETLACDDWLDLWEHFGGRHPPEGVYWLMVTPEMAARCLKIAKVDAFWSPEAQEAFNPELGFFRALK